MHAGQGTAQQEQQQDLRSTASSTPAAWQLLGTTAFTCLPDRASCLRPVPALERLLLKEEKAEVAVPSRPRRTAGPLVSRDRVCPEQKVTNSRAMLMGIRIWPPCAALWQYRAALHAAAVGWH